MIYLLDANVLIDANRDYFQMKRVPEFWAWLLHQGEQGKIKIPVEVYEEITSGVDELSQWGKEANTEANLLLQEDVIVDYVSHVTNVGYATDLTDIEIEQIGRDPFLIAYGYVEVGQRTIVTTEVSKPSKRRANRKVPDVCDHFNIPKCNTFQLLRALDFSTSWNA